MPTNASDPAVGHFEQACRAAIDDLRAALIEVYASVGADPASPQDVARRFGVNKTLTWSVSRLVSGRDSLSAMSSIPGSSSLRSLLTALEREGASAAALDRVRAASQTIDATVEEHLGDRGTLELVVDGIEPERQDYLELSRKLSFRGASGLWGVQARTRLMSVFMAPNAEDARRLDVAIVRGYLGIRRLRSDVRWPIFQLRGWGSKDDSMMAGRWEPLEVDPAAATAGGEPPLPLMRRFSDVGPSDLEENLVQSGQDYILGPGPIGNSGLVDCFVGDCARSAAPGYRTEADATGEFGATISVPTERLVFDLIVHEDLRFAESLEVIARGGALPAFDGSASIEDLPRIPVPNEIVSLPGRPPVVATPLVPRYPELVQFVHQRMGWQPSRFRGRRFELSYPPMGSTILLRFELPAP